MFRHEGFALCLDSGCTALGVTFSKRVFLEKDRLGLLCAGEAPLVCSTSMEDLALGRHGKADDGTEEMPIYNRVVRMH